MFKSKQPVKSGSFSVLKTFEECPARTYFKRILRIPEPERPPPTKGTEHANDRGTRIHTAAEHYVLRETSTLIPELRHFEHDLDHLRKCYPDGTVLLEAPFHVDSAWKAVPVDAHAYIWLRAYIDIFYFLSPEEAVSVDLKTGKRFGNEIRHTEQNQLYQLLGFKRFPSLQVIHTENWYFDIDELHRITYTRRQGERYLRGYNERMTTLTTTTRFVPRPSKYICRFCPYGPKEFSNKWVNKSNHCKYGVN